MDNINFCNNFTFRNFKFAKYRFTDHFFYPGCPTNFIGRMIKGTAKLNTHHNSINVKAGDIFYIPKNVMYQSRWYGDENDAIEFQSFGFKVFPKDKNITYSLQVLSPDTESITLLNLISEDMAENCLNIGRLYSFVGNVMQYMETDTQSSKDKSINIAIEYINNNPQCTVSDIAKHCDMSESGIYALFRRTLNKTPVDVKHTVLIEKARELLVTTDLPIENISDKLGFSSSSYFRKIMKEETGKTPREIRKEAQF